MTVATWQFCFVYCSPAGTTRHLAAVAAATLSGRGEACSLEEIGRPGTLAAVRERLTAHPGPLCLFLGSPVYSSHALPPVMEFIAGLPAGKTAVAVPYVTWGGATSGVALYEMAAALGEKNYRVVGAAKVLAVHSLMWQAESPLAAGHPDAADEKLMRQLAETVASRLAGPSLPAMLPLEVLRYQPPAAFEQMMGASLDLARRTLPPRQVDREICTRCGDCADACPVGAVSLEPFPSWGSACILCFNCMRLCPEGAVKADLGLVHEYIRRRAADFAETSGSQVFLP